MYSKQLANPQGNFNILVVCKRIQLQDAKHLTGCNLSDRYG